MIKTRNFITLVLILYFILRTHGIVQIFPAVWIFPLLILTIYSVTLLIKNKKTHYFLFLKSKWILISFFILLIYFINQFGNFKLNSTLLYLISSIPFYIIGFYSGLVPKNNLVYRVSIYYVLFLFIYLLPKSLFVLSQNTFNSELFISLFVDNIEDNDVIFFLPFLSFITIYGGYILIISRFQFKVIITTVIITFNLLALFLAGKAGAFAVIFFTLIIYYYKGNTSVILKYRNSVVTVSLVVLFLIGVNSGLFGELGTLKSKSEGVVMLIESGLIINDDILNIITSDRWTAGLHSINQFLNKPIFGNGAYLELVPLGTGASKFLTTVAGGHSFFLDTLAYYGIFGLPIIMILLSFFNISNQYSKLLKSNFYDNKEALIFSSLMGSIIIINILNTGFLFSYFDNFLFLLSGYYLGKYYRLLNPI